MALAGSSPATEVAVDGAAAAVAVFDAGPVCFVFWTGALVGVLVAMSTKILQK